MSDDVRLDDIKTLLDEFKRNVDKRFDQVDKRFDQVDKRFDQSDKKLDEISNNVSLLKGATALLETVVEAPNIAKDMGFHYDSTLTSNEAQDLVDKITEQTGAAVKGELEAFRNTDLFISATVPRSGQKVIIPVSASWGLSGKDVKGVKKHAEFAKRILGDVLAKPAVSARNVSEGVLRFARNEEVHVNQLRKVF